MLSIGGDKGLKMSIILPCSRIKQVNNNCHMRLQIDTRMGEDNLMRCSDSYEQEGWKSGKSGQKC